MIHAEKEKRAAAVALKLEEERKAGECARLAKAQQHRAVQQQQKQIAQEVSILLACPGIACLRLTSQVHKLAVAARSIVACAVSPFLCHLYATILCHHTTQVCHLAVK